MIRVRTAVEALMYGSILSEGIGNETNPIKFLLGDLTANQGTLAGPSGAGQLSLVEILMNDANYSASRPSASGGYNIISTVGGVGAAGGAPAMQMAIDNINANFGNMFIKTLTVGGGFKLFDVAMRKPINKVNKAIRDAGFGKIVQL